MSIRPEILQIDVGAARLGAARWPSERAAPLVVAAHGITANMFSWSAVARHLDGRCDLVAVDLRGRGQSSAAPGPFGMRRHADDLAAVARHLDAERIVIAGHSMGTYVGLACAERHPELVAGLVLVDGGHPLPLPEGADPQEVLDATVGPAIERLRRVWVDRVEYRTMWSSHPAFADGLTPELERYLLGDLTPCDGGFRSIVSEPAVRFDGGELLVDAELRGLLERRTEPTTIIRAATGLAAEPPPFMPDALLAEHPHHDWRSVPGTNHYTVLVGEPGAAAVAQAIVDVAG